ncbi:MAG: segregation/condensation protein A [Eubacterium sp.]|jgi:segregation and condensation protein A|nr:segregation/condensation protein A [Eubacterium sp.]
MKTLNFKTEVFEGPLDLMLALIAKHKLDILDIEISVLLEQFLAYLDEMLDADMEIAGEFLEMAARLIYIKSASLLPKHEIDKIKKELEGLLVEYALCKQAALRLHSKYVGADIFIRKPQDIPTDTEYNISHDPYDLYSALSFIIDKDKLAKLSAGVPEPFVPKSYVAVFTKVLYVLRKIRFGGQIRVDDLYTDQTRSEQVAIFLSLLELSKLGRISFSSDNKYLKIAGRKSNENI